MASIQIRLDPGRLENPDLDIRYLLPDLLTERSGGGITDDGYDYVGKENYLVLFLQTGEVDSAVACVVDVIENTRILGNDLRPAAVVALERDGARRVVYPPGFEGPFLPG